MTRTLNTALVGAITFWGLAMSLLLVTPASAVPKLPVAVEDQIRHLCEASSADLSGKRDERRCRAEWRKKLEDMGAGNARAVRLVLR